MIRAIKVLESRIKELNNEIEHCLEVANEPEMLCDYEFAINDAANCELEIIEMQNAIKILNENQDQ